jgi:hypothetical protein
MSSAAQAQFDVGLPTDDVWAYRHSGNPGGDPVIRLWGDGTNELNPTGYPGLPDTEDYFSYGFATWDLSNVPRNYRWNGATITLTVAPDTNYDPQRFDVYIRLLTSPFDEGTWIFGQGPRPVAGEMNRILGDDSRVANGPGSTITFRIPRNVPQNILQTWARTKRMNIAITCTADYAIERQIIRIGSSENVLYEGPDLFLE